MTKLMVVLDGFIHGRGRPTEVKRQRSETEQSARDAINEQVRITDRARRIGLELQTLRSRKRK